MNVKPKQYLSRISSSARGEAFNPLTWPFLFATLAYGAGFAFFSFTTGVSESSLFQAMTSLAPAIPVLWGIVAILTIVGGFTFLLFNIPPAGKLSGLIGFMLWLFASFCWGLTGGWLLILSIGLPNMYFWFWQYLNLSFFRGQEAKDKQTMKDYDSGGYDDSNGGKELRETNRGRDVQSSGSYDNPDDGGDTSRFIDKLR